jgi:hypothetical protein
MNTNVIPIKKNFINIRQERQYNNNQLVYNCLKNQDKKLFYDCINVKEYQKLLLYLEKTEEEIFEKCNNDDDYTKLLSSKISKISSRQSCNDETEQIHICSLIGKECGINIKQLSTTDKRPTKNGMIITKKKMTQYNINKNDCLKSFDAEITGKINGFISAKVLFGNGGHQDNVFEEINILGEWWITYKYDTNDILILLIDTDLEKKFNYLCEKYFNRNIYVFNHYSFQEFMIENYYKTEST